MKKVIFGVKSRTETPQMILERIKKLFPQLEQNYQIGKGCLSQLEHLKPAYQIGMVFPLVDIVDGQDAGMVIYYPIKDAVVHSVCRQPYFPIKAGEFCLNTRRGMIRAEDLNGECVLTYTQLYNDKI